MTTGDVARGVVVWEAAWWAVGKVERQRQFQTALGTARRMAGPVLVVGLPDGQYPWPRPGDTVVDLRPRPADVPRGVRYVQADAARLPFARGEFASCFCSHVVEHTADPIAVMRELRRVSRTPPCVCYPRPWRIATWLVPGHRWLMVQGRHGFRFRPNPLSDGRVNMPTRYGTIRPTVFGALAADATPPRGPIVTRRQIAAAITLGAGASALANVITRRVSTKAGFGPALFSAVAVTGVGVYLMATS